MIRHVTADTLALLGGKRALVIGDVMLDRYALARERSGEAGRRVDFAKAEIEYELLAPGGAACVAAACRRLGAQVELVSVVGRDPEAAILSGELTALGIDASGVRSLPSARTTTKTRYSLAGKPHIRFDRDNTTDVAAGEAARIADAIATSAADVVIISDYRKGLFDEASLEKAVAAARRRDVPVLVDSKSPSARALAGADWVVPTAAELLRWRDGRREDLPEVARSLGLRRALVKCGKDGLLLVDGDRCEVVSPFPIPEEVDSVGAGDATIAAVALAVAAGASPLAAAELGSCAGAAAAARFGSVPPSARELMVALAARRAGIYADLDGLVAKLAWWRSRRLSIAFTNGCFDLLHAGHVSSINETARHADRLVVALNTDASVRRLKGEERPIEPWSRRAAAVVSLAAVAAVIDLDADTPHDLVAAVKPDVIAKGGDYHPDDIAGARQVELAGGRVLTTPLLAGCSTSSIVARIRQGGEAL